MSLERVDRKPVRVLIGLCAQDTVSASLAFSLVRCVAYTIMTMPEVELNLVMVRGTLLPQQRQEIAMRAVAGEYTHVLFVDGDMKFSQDALVRLLQRGEAIVGCNYPTRRLPIKPTAMKETPEGTFEYVYTGPESTGLEQVRHLGFGLILIQTEVLKALPLPWFNLLYNPKSHSFGGEDVHFCLHATYHGYPVFVDHDVSQQVSHLGEWEYEHGHALQIREKFGIPNEESTT